MSREAKWTWIGDCNNKKINQDPYLKSTALGMYVAGVSKLGRNHNTNLLELREITMAFCKVGWLLLECSTFKWVNLGGTHVCYETMVWIWTPKCKLSYFLENEQVEYLEWLNF